MIDSHQQNVVNGRPTVCCSWRVCVGLFEIPVVIPVKSKTLTRPLKCLRHFRNLDEKIYKREGLGPEREKMEKEE